MKNQIELQQEILKVQSQIREIQQNLKNSKSYLKYLKECFEDEREQIEKEFLIVWNAETGHQEKFTISKLKEENEKEGFFEWVPTFLESEHFLNNMKVGQVELMETERDFQDDNLKVAVYRIK